MPLAFDPESEAKIVEIVGRYPNTHAALLPVLWVAQRQFGVVSREVMTLVAQRLNLPETKVVATATFYTMYDKRPVGRYHIQICKNISCYLRRSDDVTRAISDKLGIKPGETTDDELFTLSEVECLAACGTAPVIQVNRDYHESMTAESAGALIDQLRGDT